MNYTQLVNDVKKYANRGESLNLMIPTFISLAEEAMYNNDEEPLQVRALATASTTTTNNRIIATPARVEKIRAAKLKRNGISYPVKFRAPDQMKVRSGTGTPSYFSFLNDEIEFDITPDDEYVFELQYYRRAPAITEANPTNDVLTNHYSIYLFGTLSELFSHVLDTEQEQRYRTKFILAIKGANKAAKKARFGPSPQMTVEGYRP